MRTKQTSATARREELGMECHAVGGRLREIGHALNSGTLSRKQLGIYVVAALAELSRLGQRAVQQADEQA